MRTHAIATATLLSLLLGGLVPAPLADAAWACPPTGYCAIGELPVAIEHPVAAVSSAGTLYVFGSAEGELRLYSRAAGDANFAASPVLRLPGENIGHEYDIAAVGADVYIMLGSKLIRSTSSGTTTTLASVSVSPIIWSAVREGVLYYGHFMHFVAYNLATGAIAHFQPAYYENPGSVFWDTRGACGAPDGRPKGTVSVEGHTYAGIIETIHMAGGNRYGASVHLLHRDYGRGVWDARVATVFDHAPSALAGYWECSAIAVGPTIYFVGGSGSEYGDRYDQIVRYDTTTMSIDVIDDALPRARRDVGLAFDGSAIIVVGGHESSSWTRAVGRFALSE